MKSKFMIFFLASMMLLIQSCNSNQDAEYAFKAATAGMAENIVSPRANDAFFVLNELNIKDACMLTLAYYYLYDQDYSMEYGERFGKCYKYAMGKNEAKANEYFNKLTGVAEAASEMKNCYENLGLMRQASETFGRIK